MIDRILYGRKKSLTLPTGEKRMAQYVIVELGQIKASHDEISFADSEGYPVNEYGRNINDRNYKTDTAAQSTVRSIAQHLDADKLIELTSSPSGTPIISEQGFVVSGNNRIMSLKLAAAHYPEQYKKYVETLAAEAVSFGFSDMVGMALLLMHDRISLPGSSFNDPKSVTFERPVLVRIDPEIPVLNTTELSKYNQTGRKGERPVDQAVKLGNILRENEKCRSVILSVIDGYETFSDLYSSAGRADRKRLAQAFVDCNLIPEQQLVSYYTEGGEFTDQGKDFVESVLSAMVLSPDALNVAGTEGVKRLRQIIISSLPVLITNENLPSGSLRPYISEAVIIEYKARQVGDFSDYLASQSLFGDSDFDEKSYYLNRLLNEGRNKFKETIKRYTDSVRDNAGASLFAGAQMSAEEIFQKTVVAQIAAADKKAIEMKFSKSSDSKDVTGGGSTPFPPLSTPSASVTPLPVPAEPALWITDAWFTENPEKVLGTPYETSGRFGPVTKYKGTLEDLQKIEVSNDFPGNIRGQSNPLLSVVPDRNPDLDALTPTMGVRIDQIVEQSETEVDQKIIRKVRGKKVKAIAERASNDNGITDETIAVKQTADLQTFEEIYARYNPGISKEELEVFIWWKTNSGKPLSGRWVNLLEPGRYTDGSVSRSQRYTVEESRVTDWVKKGLLFYYDQNFEPEVIYLSGNVYDKKAQLARDKETIIEKYGADVFEKQTNAFSVAFKKKYDSRLIITGQSKDGLALLPTSKFADEFFVTTLEMVAEGSNLKALRVNAAGDQYGQPNLIKDPESYDHHRDEFAQLNLRYAFGLWLTRGTFAMLEPISPMDIIRFSLLGARMMNKEEKGTLAYEKEKARIEKLKSSVQREGSRLFLIFLEDQLTPNDKIRLETQWNSVFNNHLPVDYNKVPVAFTMCKYYKGKPETLKPEKREAVAFSIIEGSSCLAYDVGVGKTPSAIFTISAFMDAGYARRPFICVPNQVYKQFISEIKNFAPHIPILEAYNLAPEYASNFQGVNGQIEKVPEGTVTVMTYEGLERIGFSDQTSHELFTELYEILNQGGEDERQKTQKQRESFSSKLESIIGKGLRGTMFNIEDFGFDFGCYDEAHKMKKVFTAVKGEMKESDTGKKTRGSNPYVINSGTPSSIGLKGFMLNYYIQKNNGWQNVLLLTATPFTNSPLEIFSMLSMVAYNKLRQTDLNNIKLFFDTYVATSTELVINSRLQPQFKQVILGFNNLLAMQTLIRRFINYKTGDQVNVQRPKKYVLPYLRRLEGETVINLPEDERVETYIEMTPAQKAMMADIVSYVEGKITLSGLAKGAGDSVINEDSEGDGEGTEGSMTQGVEVDFDVLDDKEKMGVKTIRGITFSRNLALSPYLYEYSGMKAPTAKQYVGTSPKLKYVMECVRTVKAYHEKRKEAVSGQIIYMDRGVEYFGLLKQYLVEEIGYAPHEIGIIKSGLPKNGKTSKEYIKNLFNGEIYNESTKLFDQVEDSQRIKIVIGSSTIKEGINLQKYGTVLYNCFIDWNPTDIQQLEGRLWRQGNTFASIRIVNPLVTDSADIFLFQKLQEKTARLNSIWASDSRTNVLNTEEFNPQDLKLALIRDPRVVAQLMSVEETAKIDERILGNDRLIENAKRMMQIVASINYHYSNLETLVKTYRSFSPTGNRVTDGERLVKLALEIEKQGTDIKGRKIYNRWEAQELREKDKWNDKKMVEEASRHGASEGEVSKFNRPYGFADFSLAVRDFKKAYSTFLLPNRIDITTENTDALDKFSKNQERIIAELRTMKEKLAAPEYIDQLTKGVIEDRIANKVEYKSLERTVHDFTKLNYLLSDRKVVMTAPALTVTCPPMIGTERLTDPESLVQLENCVVSQTETKLLHLEPDGITYTVQRAALHKKIVDDLFEHVKCIRGNEPIAIFTGGAPGSGKSTFLRKIPWLMDEKGTVNPSIFHIDADAIREKLPEYTGWNASATHRETQDIVGDVLSKLGHGSCRYDFIYDGTMNRADKYFPLIKRVKAMGYKTFIIFMDVPYSVSRQRALERYKKRGRYVPMEVIDDFFTMLPQPINKTKGQYALDQLKSEVDGYIVVDGVTGQITDSKGVNLPKERYYKKERVQLVGRSEAKLSVVPARKQQRPASIPAMVAIPAKRVITKAVIKKQIAALKAAAMFSDNSEKINRQIKALGAALMFAA